MIKLTDVTKRYKKGGPVLSDVNLVIRDGEFVFLTGPCGSGKSTVLKLLTGETKPTEGRVSVNGYDMESLSKWQIPYVRRTLGCVYQDYRLLLDRTVRENLELAIRAVNIGYEGAEGRIEYALRLTGMLGRIDAEVNTLSGGERQRVGIARAMVNDPQAILADEPTGNLDDGQADGIMSLLAGIHESGVTVLVVTHDDQAVRRYGFRSVGIERGRIVYDGSGYYMSAVTKKYMAFLEGKTK